MSQATLTFKIAGLTPEQIIRLVRTAPKNVAIDCPTTELPDDPVARGLLFGVVRRTLKGRTVREAYLNSVGKLTIAELKALGLRWYHPGWGQMPELLGSFESRHPVLGRIVQRLSLEEFATLAERGALSEPQGRELCGHVDFPKKLQDSVCLADMPADALAAVGKALPLDKKQWAAYVRNRLARQQPLPESILSFAPLEKEYVLALARALPLPGFRKLTPFVWDWCTPEQKYRLIYAWAHAAMRNDQPARLLDLPAEWLQYFRPKKLAPLFHSLPHTGCGGFYAARSAVKLLNYARTYSSPTNWDHKAICGALFDPSTGANPGDIPKKEVRALVAAGLRLQCDSKLIDHWFGSHHEYLMAVAEATP